MKKQVTTVGLLALAIAIWADGTRGIGQYPGDPKEYFAPTVCWTDGGGRLSNVALHRAAYASTTYDYNHTAHLVTDGRCDQREPSTLRVSTPNGILPRREAEWAIDGGKYSRNILLGSHTWLQYDWSGASQGFTPRKLKLQGMVAYDEAKTREGFAFRCQVSDDGTQWQIVGTLKGDGLPGELLHYKLHSDPNKQEAQDFLPARMLQETITMDVPSPVRHFRLLLDMEGAAHWDIRELQFVDAHGADIDVLSSQDFSSMWISNGGGEQWLYTDLGKSLPIEQVRLHWYLPPKKGCIQVSDNASQWKTVADVSATSFPQVSARYVRVLMQEPGEAGCYALREMEVLSGQQKQYVAHEVAGWRDGRYFLSGGNWRLQRASEVTACGEEVSKADFDTSDWIAATVPGTVLASYMNIGAVPNPNFADDVDQISESFFHSNFWYRDEFEATVAGNGQQQWLCFDGINWKANVFLNGQYLGRIEGAFMRGRFNVTGLLREGTNCLAVEIICNEHFAAIKEKDTLTTQFNGGILGADNPTFHATVGWDWITTVRGREAGIWNEVYLSTTGNVTLSDPYVRTEIKEAVSVTPSVFLRNHASHAVSGRLSGYIGNVKFEKNVTLPAHTEQEVSFLPAQFPQLCSRDFRLWWPNGYGEPFLYDAAFVFNGDTLSFKAGLREMRYVDPDDSLRLYVNGRRFIPKGGNWGFDEHNLLYRSREYDIAVNYHRDMNFTMIRNWVGQIGDEAFYEACDRYGIMIWQDFWLANPADGPDPYDQLLFLDNAEDYTRRMRSHPSIALYCGRNEGFPPDGLDRRLRSFVHQLAPGMEYISHSSAQGVSGGGPYRALPMKEYFQRQSGKIHSERGMPNIMNIESMRRTMSEEALWPQGLQWGQHDFTLQGAQRASDFNRLMLTGFGEADGAEQFTRWAQLINYNGYRGMFEATSSSRAGLLLWMSHPCWPSLVWQTYDYYFEPTAAYFGAKKACEPLHIQYNALTDSIEVVNHSAGDRYDLTAIACVYDLNGKKIGQKKAGVSSADDTTMTWQKLSEMMPGAPSDVYFLRLQLSDKRGAVSENTYIMGREENNYQALTRLPSTEIEVTITEHSTSQSDKQGHSLTVSLRNKGKHPAPFVRLNLKGSDGEQILPVIYSDNYLTLMPGERRTVSVSWREEDARRKKAFIEVTELISK